MLFNVGLLDRRRPTFYPQQLRNGATATYDEVNTLYGFWQQYPSGAAGHFLRSIDAAQFAAHWRSQPASFDTEVLSQSLKRLYLAGNEGAFAVLVSDAQYRWESVLVLEELATQHNQKAADALRNLPADQFLAEGRHYKSLAWREGNTSEQFWVGRVIDILKDRGNSAVIEAVQRGDVVPYRTADF